MFEGEKKRPGPRFVADAEQRRFEAVLFRAWPWIGKEACMLSITNAGMKWARAVGSEVRDRCRGTASFGLAWVGVRSKLKIQISFDDDDDMVCCLCA